MTLPAEPIRVLVADDTATVRLLLRRTLEASKAFQVVGEAADGAQAVDLAASLQPDIVLLDLSMPVLGGMEAIPRIRRCAPDARVIVLSGFDPDRMGAEAVELGATAFLEKQQRPDELVASLLQTWRSGQPRPTAAPPAPGRLVGAFEHAPLAMALVAHDDRVLHVNAALCRLTGYGRRELGVFTMADLTHPDDRQAALEARRSAAAGAPAEAVEARLLRSDGRAVWTSVSCAACGDDGDQPCLVVQLVDVTHQRRAALELSRSNSELSAFAYLAAHELKSPLQALSGFASLLERVHGPQLGAQAQEFVSWIVDGATRMDALIEDLLSYCSVDRDDTAPGLVPLQEVVSEAMGQLGAEVAARGAIVTIDPVPVLTFDRVHLGQLLRNLLANALKFVPGDRRPQIHVFAERDPDGWTVTVADNGIGVDDAARVRIFDMFQRLHPKERFKGTGIGLSICKRIVERRGGTIWVEPNGSAGSRFRFRIPDVAPPASSVPAA